MNQPKNETKVTRGIAFMIIAVTFFNLKDGIAKYLSATYPIIELVFFQYIVMLVIILPIVVFRGGWHSLATKHPYSLLLRGTIGVVAVGLLFAAVSQIPIADAYAISFISPIVVTILSPFLLGENVGIRRWFAVATGFGGVLLVIQPGFEEFQTGSLIAISAGVMFGLYGIVTRKLTQQELPRIMMVYTSFVGVIGVSAFLPTFWVTPQLVHGGIIVAMGVLATVGHALMVYSYAAAPAVVVTPFLYTSMIAATIQGYFIFGDFPNFIAWIGISTIIACGIYTTLREAKQNPSTH
ncbi:MAG TPA: DMT family transporter [Rhodospirillales bacterium]|nr:DMT family transporter [Rhodospirillales bacterium]